MGLALAYLQRRLEQQARPRDPVHVDHDVGVLPVLEPGEVPFRVPELFKNKEPWSFQDRSPKRRSISFARAPVRSCVRAHMAPTRAAASQCPGVEIVATGAWKKSCYRCMKKSCATGA